MDHTKCMRCLEPLANSEIVRGTCERCEDYIQRVGAEAGENIKRQEDHDARWERIWIAAVAISGSMWHGRVADESKKILDGAEALVQEWERRRGEVPKNQIADMEADKAYLLRRQGEEG